jgi:uncharacterized protein (TIGR00369 family)
MREIISESENVLAIGCRRLIDRIRQNDARCIDHDYHNRTVMMPEPQQQVDALLKIVQDVYENLPFNRLLGLRVAGLKPDEAGFTFSMRNALIGNDVHGILHGGVISAVLDTTGGLTATASAIRRKPGLSRDEITDWIARIGTIDMRVDYLRPGRGKRFHSTGTVMRTGNKVAVTRMELWNEEKVLIAVGTGAYIVG